MTHAHIRLFNHLSEGLPRTKVAHAAHNGLDAMRELIVETFGKNVWNRAVINAPERWEEEQMVFALCDLLSTPATSSYMWMLAKPTKHERMLLTAFHSSTKAFVGQKSSARI